MNKQRHSRAPLIIAIGLLLLPNLYVVSYLVLVWPDRMRYDSLDSRWEVFPTYRYGTEAWAGRVYWPLERLDRKLRPNAWQSSTIFLYDYRSRQIEKSLGGGF